MHYLQRLLKIVITIHHVKLPNNKNNQQNVYTLLSRETHLRPSFMVLVNSDIFFNTWLQLFKLKFLIFLPHFFESAKVEDLFLWTRRRFMIQNIFSNTYVHWCLACIHICMRIFDHVDWNYKQLWAGMSILGIELKSSGKAVYALNHWATSP